MEQENSGKDEFSEFNEISDIGVNKQGLDDSSIILEEQKEVLLGKREDQIESLLREVKHLKEKLMIKSEQLEDIQTQKTQFNEDLNQYLSVEKIVRATFSNLNRRAFQQSKAFNKVCQIHPDNVDVETMLYIAEDNIPKSIKQFDQAKIKLFSTNRLFQTLDKAAWINDLKKLKWYGPFQNEDVNKCPNVYRFQTATSEGDFGGFVFDIAMNDNQKWVILYFIDKSTNHCGHQHTFKN